MPHGTSINFFFMASIGQIYSQVFIGLEKANLFLMSNFVSVLPRPANLTAILGQNCEK